jgi:spermidine synthase
MNLLLLAIFFLSGASGLIFETLWFHQSGIALGNSVWASSLVLAGFMAGMALGNLAVARVGDRMPRPVAVYAALEVAIAAFGVALVFVLPELGWLLAPVFGGLEGNAWLLNTLRLATAFLLLLAPSTAMGATLPLLTKAVSARNPNFGRVFGSLYGWNTLGAVGGALTAEFVMIGAMGVRAAALSAGAINLIVAGIAACIAIRGAATAHGDPEPILGSRDPQSNEARSLTPHSVGLLAVAFLSGFTLLALEIVWFRFLQLFIANTSASFSIMLAVVLGGIGLGGILGSLWLRWRPEHHGFASIVAFSAGIFAITTYSRFSTAPNTWTAAASDIVALAVPLMLPVALLSGVLFPLLGAALRPGASGDAHAAGVLTLANTAGSALGSLAGGFVLLPRLGIEHSLFALALLYGVQGAILLGYGARLRSLRFVPAGAFGIAALAFPFGAMEATHIQVPIDRLTTDDTRTVAIREGLTETVVYLEHRELGETVAYQMLTNGHSMSATMWWARRYMKLYVYLPAAIHPSLESALLISYGVGSTAKALTDTRSLRHIDVVEISRDVLELSSIVYPSPNDNPLHDPRVHVHVEDGRQFLQTTERRFDLITGEPPPPANAGIVNLYTREYFELARSCLNPGGIMTYWLPIHVLNDHNSRGIIRAFCDVFEDCSLWNGSGYDLMLMATRTAKGGVSREHFAKQWADPEVADELRKLGLERPGQLGALFIADAARLRDVTRQTPPLVDDFPNRVRERSPTSPGRKLPPLYREWRDTDRARQLFGTSPLIASLWPTSIRTASASYFEAQRIINNLTTGLRLPRRGSRFSDLHYLLSETDLRAPVLWLTGSSGDLQQVVGQTGSGAPSADAARTYHEAVGALAARDHRRAIPLLAAAQESAEHGHIALKLRIYALFAAGRPAEAREVLARHHGELFRENSNLAFARFLSRTFPVGDALSPAPPTRARPSE